MENLYLVKVPVAIMVRSSDEYKITTAYHILEEMSRDMEDFVHFGEPEIEQVF